jgi:hypothetical protein
MKNQLEALRIASSNLNFNLLTISDTYESFAESAQMELKKQEQLLQNIDIDLEVISKVKIHPEFLSPAARRSQESGERSRTLGDYVSNSKMKQVADNCGTLHGGPFFPRTCISQCLSFCQRIYSNGSLQYTIHSMPSLLVQRRFDRQAPRLGNCQHKHRIIYPLTVSSVPLQNQKVACRGHGPHWND